MTTGPDSSTSTDLAQSSDAAQAELLQRFGLEQQLDRSMGFFSSFAASFSGISITNSIFLTLPFVLTQAGSAGIWTWIISSIGAFLVALVFADLVGRLPIAGYAYQWSSRLTSPRVGWFVAFTGIMGFGVGCASVVYGTASFFLSEFHITITTTSEVIWAVFLTIVLAAINIVGIRVAALINNAAIVSEIASGVVIGIALLVTALVSHPHPISFLFHQQPGAHGLYIGSFALAFLLGAYTYAAWELPADLAEETHDAPSIAAKAMLRSIILTSFVGLLLCVAYTYASPNIATSLASSSPVLSIIQYQWGYVLKDICNVFFLIAFVSVALLVLAGAARLLFSLARDKMVPFSEPLAKVSRRWVPTNAILAITVFVIGMVIVPVVISNAVSGYTLSTASVGYNLVYLIMLVCYIVQHHRGKLPPSFGRYALRRWAMPIAYAGAAWQAFLIGTLTLPSINQKVGLTTLVFIGAAGVWYVLHVHRATGRGLAGPTIHDAAISNREETPDLVT